MIREVRRLGRLLLLAFPILVLIAAAHRTLGAVAPATAPSSAASRAALHIPPLVFVARAPSGSDARGLIPGLGPRGRMLAPGGRLMTRTADGHVRPLIPADVLWDVSDPAVSWDGKRIAFAATVARDSAWRLWLVDADGANLHPLTRSDRALDLSPLGAAAARFERYDDFDPCWLPDGRLCFASTRFPQRAEADSVPVSNLFVIQPDGTGLERLTSERNGGEEPTVDPTSGRIVYARWWTNRWLASERTPLGLTDDRALAVPADTVNLWHALSILPDGDGGRLAGGDPRGRASVAAYQPAVLPDGSLIGVRAELSALAPASGRCAIVIYRRGFAAPRVLAGAGHLGASACSPAVLPGGAIAFALDRAGHGDFGLYAIRADGTGLTLLVDLPGTLELDPAPLIARTRPPVAQLPRADAMPPLPYLTLAALLHPATSFRFDCLNVFTNGPLDSAFPDAPPLQRGVRIRFYATLARPDVAGGDTAVLVRESAVDPDGGVHEDDLPADTPMFEQLVDAHGHVLRSAMGPAHVPGHNFARAGTGTKCVGCHSGHSALAVPPNYSSARWTNASPSAEVTASSIAPGCRARAAVDRRTRGPVAQIAWVAASNRGEALTLRWVSPIDVSAVVLYACRANAASRTDLRLQTCEVRLFLGDREVERTVLSQGISPQGTRASCNDVETDRIEIRPLQATGRVLGRAAVGLAEVETIARLDEN